MSSGGKYKISPEANATMSIDASGKEGKEVEEPSVPASSSEQELLETPSRRDLRLKKNVSKGQLDSVRAFMAKMREKYRPSKMPELSENHIKLLYIVSCYSETYERVMASKAARLMDKQES